MVAVPTSAWLLRILDQIKIILTASVLTGEHWEKMAKLVKPSKCMKSKGEINNI